MRQIFCIHDKATRAFMDPFFMLHKGQAIRAFSDLVNEEGHPINQHPEDYHLFQCGEFNPQDGMIVAIVPEPVIGALECVRGEPGWPEMNNG